MIAQDHVAIPPTGLMDVIGLKKMYLVGPHASAVLNYATTRDVTKIVIRENPPTPAILTRPTFIENASFIAWGRLVGWW